MSQDITIADAIRLIANRAGNEWAMTTADIAAVLKKQPAEVEDVIANNRAIIVACLPTGWRLTQHGATGLAVIRRSPRAGGWVAAIDAARAASRGDNA